MFRPSFLPPLMVYAAYGASGLTGIVGSFFVKDYVDLSAGFLAAHAFWAGIRWTMKMPVGATSWTCPSAARRPWSGLARR